MVAHILFFLIIISLIFVDKKYYKIHLIVALFSLFIFSALRYGYGNDYFSYQKDYFKIHSGSVNVYGKQIAFELLNKISPSFIFLLCIISAFFLIVFYKMIVKSVGYKYLWISFFILLINPYIFLMSLSALRQTIGLTLFIVATFFSYKRKIIPYILIILLATLFHTSAIVLLPLYFIANESKLRKVYVIIFITIILLLIVSEGVFGFAISKVLSFFDSKNYDSYVNGETNSLVSTLMYLIILVYVLINLNGLSGKALMSAKLYAFALAFGILAYRMTMLTRIQQYFDIFAVVAIPNIIKNNIRSLKHKLIPIRLKFKKIRELSNVAYLKESNLPIDLKLKSRKKTPIIKFFMRLSNVYIFPILFFTIFSLKYYSFFTSTIFKPFWDYTTIFSR